MSLVAKENRPKGSKNSQGRHHKKGYHSFQKAGPKVDIVKKQKTKDNGEKNVVLAKCCNDGKKSHYVRNCLKPPKT